MSLSPSHPPKFLLDENVKRRLERFLKSKGFDALFAPKGTVNGKLASLTISEGRVLITNDADFEKPEEFPKERIFGIVLIRVPQDKPQSLLDAFERLLAEHGSMEYFEGHLILLHEGDPERFSLQSAFRK